MSQNIKIKGVFIAVTASYSRTLPATEGAYEAVFDFG
jgi:hypothetical protein